MSESRREPLVRALDEAEDHFGEDQKVHVLPAPSNPMAVARELLKDRYHKETKALMLRHWRAGWMRWDGPAWVEVEDRAIRAEAYHKVEHAEYWAPTKDDSELRSWAPNRHKMADLLDAMAAVTLLESKAQPPTWVETTGPTQIISCANGLLDLTTRTRRPHDPRYFTLVSVPFDYDPDAGEPVEWLRFLESIWDDDSERKDALQEWYGYVLSGRLDLDKILMLPGPPRAGKRMIAEVLSCLIGKANVAGITLARLSEQFGLQDLTHKPLAVIPDARVGRESRVAVERLLSISGEDTLNIERKHREDWVGQLPTRLMMLTNELPNFRDASGALPNRFLVLELTKSWLNREDRTLLNRLMGELPAILNWALDGLERLNDNGHFTEPQSSKDSVISLIDIASPTAAFRRERLSWDPGSGVELSVPDLWAAWKAWCDENGHRPGNRQQLGKDLRAVIPGLQPPGRSRDGNVRVRVYRGLALIDEEPQQEDPDQREPL